MILAGFVFLLRTAAGVLRRTTLKATQPTFLRDTLVRGDSLQNSARVSSHPLPQASSQLDSGSGCSCSSSYEMGGSRNRKQVQQDGLDEGRSGSPTLIGDIIQGSGQVTGAGSHGASHYEYLCCRERELQWKLCLVKEQQLRQLLQQMRKGNGDDDREEKEGEKERVAAISYPSRWQQCTQIPEGGCRQLLLQLYSNDATDPLDTSSSSPYRSSGVLPCPNYSFGGLGCTSSTSSCPCHESPYPILEPRNNHRLHKQTKHRQTKHRPPPSFLYSLMAFLAFHFILFLNYIYPHAKASIQGLFALERRLKAREQATGLLCGAMTWWWQVACTCWGIAGGDRGGRGRGTFGEKGEKGGVAGGGGRGTQAHKGKQSAKEMREEEHDVFVGQWVWWGVAEVVGGLCKGFEGGLKVWCETDENAGVIK